MTDFQNYKLKRAIRSLEDAIAVCAKATADESDHTKTYAFATGWSKSAMREVLRDLQTFR